MSVARGWAGVLAVVLVSLGCDDGADGTAAADGGLDRGAAASDAAGDARAGDAQPDGARPDASLPDVGPDAALHDALPADAAAMDAGRPDATPEDSAVADAAVDQGVAACRQTVVVDGWEVFAFEASRADATAEAAGAADEACSRRGVLPWTGLTVVDARAACEAVGFSLCTGAVWERTCAGDPGSVDYRAFPYGNAHAGGLCNDHVSGGGALEVTGHRAGCATPEGVFDLSGNVWELVDDPLGRRGASWRPDAVNFRVDSARCDRQVFVGEAFFADDLGFRCCRPAP